MTFVARRLLRVSVRSDVTALVYSALMGQLLIWKFGERYCHGLILMGLTSTVRTSNEMACVAHGHLSHQKNGRLDLKGLGRIV